MINNKYRPSLSGLMNLCSVNYMLTTKLLGQSHELNDQLQFFINDALQYQITILEVTRYTTLVRIEQQQAVSEDLHQSVSNALTPSMTIRLYHDARMAEVITSQSIRRIKPRYDYPNQKMHLPDEKQQTNLFLKEWLQMCHEHGQSQIDSSAFSSTSSNNSNSKPL